MLCKLNQTLTDAWTDKPLSLIMELAAGNLREYYSKKKEQLFGPYEWSRALAACLDAARGMFYVHSMNLVHRDLKSDNIMITNKWRGKVADYGLARYRNAEKTMTSTGSAQWMVRFFFLSLSIC